MNFLSRLLHYRVLIALLLVLVLSFFFLNIPLQTFIYHPSALLMRWIEYSKPLHLSLSYALTPLLHTLLWPLLLLISRKFFLPTLNAYAYQMIWGLLLSMSLAALAKYLFGFSRPSLWFNEGIYAFSPFQGGDDYYAVPSSHAVIAFLLANTYKKLRLPLSPLLFSIALLAAFSRIVLCKHYLSDIVGAYLLVLGAISMLPHLLKIVEKNKAYQHLLPLLTFQHRRNAP